ncbi:DgyrCDS14125 [Dimorphilus gyrociliatus]|uniref:DgyrCDS14125 n=1 Tax=Dimorphilus gyrociliatus TaxID=2664684 RepID=A0A7I8WCP7_9ANNE|nr:DgyrCDS14125 [Dimorphilus gyrociliatus]
MSSIYRNCLRIALFTLLLIVIFANVRDQDSQVSVGRDIQAPDHPVQGIEIQDSVIKGMEQDLADGRRGGGARFGSRFRSRYSSTRIRQRYGTRVRVRHGYSRFGVGGSNFQSAMTADPTVCRGQPSIRPTNSTKIQYFICPEENMPDSLRYCCGASLSEHCCDDSSGSSGSKAGMMIGIIGAIACGLCIISTVIFVCKKKAAQPGAIILKPSHSKGDKSNTEAAVIYQSTETQPTVPNYPAPTSYQEQAPMGYQSYVGQNPYPPPDPKDVPAYPAAQYPPMPQAHPVAMPPPAPYPTAPNPDAPPYPGAGMPTMPPYPGTYIDLYEMTKNHGIFLTKIENVDEQYQRSNTGDWCLKVSKNGIEWFTVRTVFDRVLERCYVESCGFSCPRAHSSIELTLWKIDENDEVFCLKYLKKQLLDCLEQSDTDDYFSSAVQSLTSDSGELVDVLRDALWEQYERGNGMVKIKINLKRVVEECIYNFFQREQEMLTEKSKKSLEHSLITDGSPILIEGPIYKPKCQSALILDDTENNLNYTTGNSSIDSQQNKNEALNNKSQISTEAVVGAVNHSTTLTTSDSATDSSQKKKRARNRKPKSGATNKKIERKLSSVKIDQKPMITIDKRNYYINLSCEECLKLVDRDGLKFFNFDEEMKHNCKKNILIASTENFPNAWYKISYKGPSIYIKNCPLALLCQKKNCNKAHSTIEHIFNLAEIKANDLKSSFPIIPKSLRKKLQTDKVAVVKDSQTLSASNIISSLKLICEKCWINEKCICEPKNRAKNCVEKMKNSANLSTIAIMLPNKIIIRNPNFSDLTQKANSPEEMECWKWMREKRINNLNTLIKIEEQRKLNPNQRIDNIIKALNDQTMSNCLPVNNYSFETHNFKDIKSLSCNYCNKICTSEKQMLAHEQSSLHITQKLIQDNVIWKFRKCPNLSATNYQLCQKHKEGKCKYSKSLEKQNFCADAHSIEEMTEWYDRKQYASNMKKIKKEKELLKHIKDFNEKIKNDKSLLKRNISGVSYQLSPDCPKTSISLTNSTSFEWKIFLKCEQKLKAIHLIYPEYLFNFHILSKDSQKVYYCLEDDLEYTSLNQSYSINICFDCIKNGSFYQSLIVELENLDNFLEIPFYVDVGENDALMNLEFERSKYDCRVWSNMNYTIIPYENFVTELNGTTNDKLTNELMKKYSKKSLNKVIIQEEYEREVNYVKYYQKLLYLEEYYCQKLLDVFIHGKTKAVITNFIQTELHGIKYSSDDTLFAKIPISNLVPDTKSGNILARNCSYILIKVITNEDDETPVVYETLIVRDSNFGLCLDDLDYLYVHLSRTVVNLIGLKPSMELEIECKIVLNPYKFCHWHYALNELDKRNLIHLTSPEDTALNMIQKIYHLTECKTEIETNLQQRKVVSAIINQSLLGSKPIVVYGPFGCGKTEILATSVKAIKINNSLSRILICTHVNIAADLYILKYFHKYKSLNIKRIYNSDRRLDTVDEMVLPFCFRKDNEFYIPSAKEIENTDVIVTTIDQCIELYKMKAYGLFSHILIDEAGQILEYEMWQAFLLANNKTKIVMAGDYLQMTLPVYSDNSNLKISLLERLTKYYISKSKENFEIVESNCIFLKQNYRSRPQILEFLSKAFYQRSDSIVSCGNFPDNGPNNKCLYFHNNENSKESSSNYSYINLGEIQQTEYVIKELMRLENVKQANITVISYYTDQVKQIRCCLRKAGLYNVKVLSSNSVQGQEYDIVIINTVRTEYLDNQETVNSFGFFNDKSLINTIMSRARHKIIVIGNGNSLCNYGKCTSIWIDYIKECSKLGTFYPIDYDLNSMFNSAINSKEYEDIDSECDNILKRLAEMKVDMNYEDYEFKQLEELLRYSDFNLPKKVYNIFPETATESVARFDRPNTVTILEKKLCRIAFNSIPCAQPLRPEEAEIVISAFQLDITGLNCNEDNELYNFRNFSDRRFSFQDDLTVVGFYELAGKKWPLVLHIVKRMRNFTGDAILCRANILQRGQFIPLNSAIPRLICCNCEKDNNGFQIPIFSSYKSIKENKSVDVHSSKNLLFIIRCLVWSRKHHYSLGICIGYIDIKSDLSSTIKALNFKTNQPHRVKELFFKSGEFKAIASTGETGRIDLTSHFAFTIDSENTRMADDAFTFEKFSSQHYRIGVHIADVSRFIPKDSVVDRDIKKRCISYYATIGITHHMFPTQIGDFFSLNPHCERYTLTVFYEYDNGQWIKSDPIKTIIKSKRKFSYKTAQDIIINNNNHNISLDLRRMYELVQQLRKLRLGISFFSNTLNFDSPENEAQSLVEELAIQTNHRIAEYLYSRYDNILIRTQYPAELKLEAWKIEYYEHNLKNFELSSNHVGSTAENKFNPESVNKNPVEISKSKWLKIIDLLEQSEIREAKRMLTDTNNFPKHGLSLAALRDSLNKSAYDVCSSNFKVGHFGLKLDIYTHFTSPIRRYIDIVVQRLVTRALEGENSNIYSIRELLEICHESNVKINASNRYKSNLAMFGLTFLLKERSALFEVVIHSFSIGSVDVKFLKLGSLLNSTCRTIRSGYLGLNKTPELTDDDLLKLSWKQKIYDNKISKCQNTNNKVIQLDNKSNVTKIPNRIWQEILTFIKDDKGEKIVSLLSNMKDLTKRTHEIEIPYATSSLNLDLNSTVYEYEKTQSIVDREFVQFELSISKGDILKLQVGWAIENNLLIPKPQYLKLSSNHGICIQHSSDAINSFTNFTPSKASSLRYSTISQYKELWKPILELNAVYNSLKNSEGYILRNVEITWMKLLKNTFGYFKFNEKLNTELKLKLDDDDYVCIRYYNIYKEENDKWLDNLDIEPLKTVLNNLYNKQDTFQELSNFSVSKIKEIHSNYNANWNDIVWIGHGIIKTTDDGFEIDLNEASRKLHPELLGETQYLATLEIIHKSLADRYRIKAIQSLNCDESSLVNDIILAKNSPSSSKTVTFDRVTSVPGLFCLNTNQTRAVSSALSQEFTLIQGPPGTGKTLTCSHLIKNFLDRNKPGEVLMFCGPSNKSVNVIMDYLVKISGINFLRVMGQTAEILDFPLPKRKGNIADQSENLKYDPKMKKYILHQIVHEDVKVQQIYKEIYECTNILEMMEKTETYLQIFKEKKIERIKKSRIILTTCTNSYTKVLRKAFDNGELKLKQLIIDEAAMCTEAETLIPMATYKPEQIVLVGDQQQLEPIVTCMTTVQLGSKQSLFSRYAKLDPKIMVMLTDQYRMHSEIAQFPSKYFYNSKLKPVSEWQTTPLNDMYTGAVFYHIIGKEKSTYVSTIQSAEMFKSNVEEAKFALKAIEKLRLRGIKPENIVVLAPYRAQIFELFALMEKQSYYKQKLYLGVSVQSIVSSQGSEWDYVILTCVRSIDENCNPPKTLGFIGHPNHINVAITRAKKGLMIIGNENVLCKYLCWEHLLEHYKAKQCIVNVNM